MPEIVPYYGLLPATLVARVMATYKFSPAERYAVFTVHREKCWLCNEPVPLLEVEVDHIIPESLIGKPELVEVLANLGLPADHNINSFANWMPAHRQCNGAKGNIVFNPSPMIQLKLQAALDRADKAQGLHDNYVTERKISLSINLLLQAQEIGGFSERNKNRIALLVGIVEQAHELNREPEAIGSPLFLAPWLQVVHQDENFIYLRGPGGMVGGRPKAKNLDPSWDCPRCGPTGWNGARCVTCGMLDDGD